MSNVVLVVDMVRGFCEEGDSVSVIDGSTDSVITTIAVGLRPTAIAVNPTTNRIYVTNGDDDTVSVIDGASNTVSATVTLAAVAGGGSAGRAFDQDRSSLSIARNRSSGERSEDEPFGYREGELHG